jgi:multidrug resistance efflux pump
LPGAAPARVKWTTAAPNAAGPYVAAEGAGSDALLKQYPLLNTNLAETRKALIDTEFALQQAQRVVDLAKTEKNPDSNAARVAQDNLALAQRHVDRVRQEYQSQLQLLELQADSARTRATEADRDYERVKSLGERGAVSREEIDKRQTAAAAAKNELQSIMTLLDLHRRAAGAPGAPASNTPSKTPSR